jgi:PKD repeat protein
MFLFSCEKTPEAIFYTNTLEPEVGQEVYFTNDSRNAVDFEWDFGDGYISNDENPSHIFTGTGTYEVILTVVSKNGIEDKTSLTLSVMIPTLLEVEVLEYYDRYAVADASVFLYSSITDWDAHNDNNVTEGFTDANGFVVFSGLDPFVYYVDVWEQNHDNYDLGVENIDLIRTAEILPHQINRFVALVDYFATVKGAERGSRKVVIKSIQRKAESALQQATGSGSQDWKELYSRRVVKK